MSNSKLVDYVKISPNSSNPRNHKIDKITIHHMAGNLSVESCGVVFQPKSRQASSNYGIGSDGRVGMYVEEANRAWTSSSAENDNRAVTIEVANDEIGGNWHVSDKALAKLIDLCVDICKRNGIAKLNYTGDKSGNLTMHKWFAATNCPGPYLESKFPYIAEEVNKRLNAAAEPAESATLYRVQVGAYSQKANAEKMLAKLKAAGFDAFITSTTTQAAANDPKPNALKVGALVRVKVGAKDYDGGTLAPFVYARNHTIKSIKGDRVVITFDGVIVAAVHAEDLTLL